MTLANVFHAHFLCPNVGGRVFLIVVVTVVVVVVAAVVVVDMLPVERVGLSITAFGTCQLTNKQIHSSLYSS